MLVTAFSATERVHRLAGCLIMQLVVLLSFKLSIFVLKYHDCCPSQNFISLSSIRPIYQRLTYPLFLLQLLEHISLFLLLEKFYFFLFRYTSLSL